MNIKVAAPLAIVLVVAVGAGVWYYQTKIRQTLPPGFASGNGRIEANELDIATRFPARIVSVDINEGDLVDAGQIIAHLDSDELNAQLRGAEAEAQQARRLRDQASFVLSQRRSELELAQKELNRNKELLKRNLIAQQAFDQLRSRTDGAVAALAAAGSQLAANDAAIQRAEAAIQQLQTQVNDSVLKTPRAGRVLYRLAEPGEVLGAGGRVATVLDLSDIYMTVFLPANIAGRIAIGAQARIVLDSQPKQPIPAQVSFVSARAQFTPKQVETQNERERMVFRVKLRVPQTLVQQNLEQVKTGVLGVAYVQLDKSAPWPSWLQSPLAAESTPPQKYAP